MTTLHHRCTAFLDRQRQNAILRQGSPVDDLVAFVVAETGRTADPKLQESLPLVVYFGTDADRDEFIAAVHEAKPNMTVKKMP